MDLVNYAEEPGSIRATAGRSQWRSAMRATDKWIGTGESLGVLMAQAFPPQDDSLRALSSRPLEDPAGT
jgi:hypothetical protein